MKKILVIFLSLFLATTMGCQNQPPASAGPTKEYKLMGDTEISIIAPSAPWVESVQTVGEEEANLGLPADTVLGVTFRRPDKEGLIAVGALGQQRNEKNELVELEEDQATLNQIANWVVKRDGERLKEEYIKVLGVNAFHMVFEVGKDDRRQKGEQVHFTKDGKHYTLSILVPSQDYDAEIGQFRNLVSGFQIIKK